MRLGAETLEKTKRDSEESLRLIVRPDEFWRLFSFGGCTTWSHICTNQHVRRRDPTAKVTTALSLDAVAIMYAGGPAQPACTTSMQEVISGCPFAFYSKQPLSSRVIYTPRMHANTVSGVTHRLRYLCCIVLGQQLRPCSAWQCCVSTI